MTTTSNPLLAEREVANPMATMLLRITQSLASQPDRVVVELTSENGVTLIVLMVAEADIGKVVGKAGRTAQSLRIILRAMAQKTGQRLELDIRSDGAPNNESLPRI